jgi:carbonic anhydrase
MPEYAELLNGYRRFRKDSYPALKDKYADLVANGQHPKLMVIACSDSRVEPARIFDVDPGELFVVRNVAALVPPFGVEHSVASAVEFAVQFLEVKQILVMGHGQCGGCKASLTRGFAGKPLGEGGAVDAWTAQLAVVRDGVVREHGSESEDALRAMEFGAVKHSIVNLGTFPWVSQKVGQGSLKLRGAFFSLSEGALYSLDSETGEFISEE